MINSDYGTKDPRSVENFGFDFSQELAAGETVTACSWTISSSTSSDYAQDANATTMFSNNPPTTTINATGTQASTLIKGGIPGALYILRAKATTSGGQTLTGAGRFFCQYC